MTKPSTAMAKREGKSLEPWPKEGPKDPAELQLTLDATKTKQQQMADALVGTVVPNALVAKAFASGAAGDVIGLTEAMRSIEEVAARVNAGDMRHPETTLVSQYMSLNAIFAELARRGCGFIGTNLEVAKGYLHLALKAQSQSRAAIETLGTLKNPQTVFAKQANFANGAQQVNNAAQTFAHGEIAGASKQSEVRPDAIDMDAGAQSPASGADSTDSAVGEVHGTEDRRGEAQGVSQRLQGRRSAASPARAKAAPCATISSRGVKR